MTVEQQYMDLKGKTVAVTGATAGLGRVTAEALASYGATVVLSCRNLEAAARAVEEIRLKHPDADVVVGPQLDLASQDSVRSFASEYIKSGRPLHILVNNAGTNYLKEWYTADGVGGLCQINYLGPYTLTRLLEGVLIRSAPSRIVNLSSVTHRYGVLKDPEKFLHNWDDGQYPTTKLANVLFAYEAQRRLGNYGVESCAVDPGGVYTSIWRNTVFAAPPLKWILGALYATPWDGAQSTLHSCRVAFGSSPKRKGFPATEISTEKQQYKYYARGLFTHPWVVDFGGCSEGGQGGLPFMSWAMGTVALSLMDWQTRNITKAKSLTETLAVPSVRSSYDKEVARKLWDMSADVASVPREVQLPKI